MQKNLLLLYFFLNSILAHAQSDFVLLKKHHKTIESFYTGSYINCRTNGEWIEAYISNISNDTLHLKPYELVHFINAWGMPAVDTLWRHERKIAVKDIDAFPKTDQSFSYIKDGTLLQIGAGGYIILNVINTLSSGDALFDNGNAARLGIAAAIFAIGTLMHISHSNEIRIGKKYKLKYVKT
jgi:hypothetical protein